MKITIIEQPKTQQTPSKLYFGDVIRITDIQSAGWPYVTYFVIAQADAGMLVLFKLDPSSNSGSFNRAFDPVEVDWHDLNTDNIREVLLWKCGKIEKVNAELTVTIID